MLFRFGAIKVTDDLRRTWHERSGRELRSEREERKKDTLRKEIAHKE